MKLVNSSGETPKDVAARFAQLACVKILGGEGEGTSTHSDMLNILQRDIASFQSNIFCVFLS